MLTGEMKKVREREIEQQKQNESFLTYFSQGLMKQRDEYK
jgi:hypothetical protein